MQRFISIFSFIFPVVLSLSAHAQPGREALKTTSFFFEKIDYWHENYANDTLDSLSYFNDRLEEYLLKLTSTDNSSISYDLSSLQNKGLNVKTSPDGNFRIYNWNTETGGTMRFYRAIFQCKVNGKVFSKLAFGSKDDIGCFYRDIQQVYVRQKPYYILCSVAVGSSALYFYTAETFSVSPEGRIEDAKLIKTKSGMQHSVGYEVDLATSVNRESTDAYTNMSLEYDTETNTILLALLDENGKVTNKKIRYRFNGESFDRLSSNTK